TTAVVPQHVPDAAAARDPEQPGLAVGQLAGVLEPLQHGRGVVTRPPILLVHASPFSLSIYPGPRRAPSTRGHGGRVTANAPASRRPCNPPPPRHPRARRVVPDPGGPRGAGGRRSTPEPTSEQCRRGTPTRRGPA